MKKRTALLVVLFIFLGQAIYAQCNYVSPELHPDDNALNCHAYLIEALKPGGTGLYNYNLLATNPSDSRSKSALISSLGLVEVSGNQLAHIVVWDQCDHSAYLISATRATSKFNSDQAYFNHEISGYNGGGDCDYCDLKFYRIPNHSGGYIPNLSAIENCMRSYHFTNPTPTIQGTYRSSGNWVTKNLSSYNSDVAPGTVYVTLAAKPTILRYRWYHYPSGAYAGGGRNKAFYVGPCYPNTVRYTVEIDYIKTKDSSCSTYEEQTISKYVQFTGTCSGGGWKTSQQTESSTTELQASDLSDQIDAPTTLAIYPNPARDFINIQLAEKGNYLLEIRDIKGRLIQTLNMDQIAQRRINLSKIQTSGTYFLTSHNLKTQVRKSQRFAVVK